MVVIRTHGFTELKSGDDLRYERAVDIREPHIATTKAIRQLGMIHSQKVQHRRVQVMGGNRLLHRPVAKLVCRATCPPQIPAPAIQAVMAPGLWSRPTPRPHSNGVSVTLLQLPWRSG